jgi:uncharacterized protein (TIGR00269 family)
MSKCRSCGEPAVVDLPRHNANFCSVHLQQLCARQVERAISDHSMFAPEDRILVAVSGGKDSLALWDMLIELGYRADGLYIGLGIGEYSEESHRITAEFADTRGLTLHTVDLREEHGFDIPTAARATRRVPCSACGLSKRHIFDRETRRHGYDVLATGHNLDDEAAVLLGNTIRWDVDYLSRQSPVLPERHGFPRKVKPLIRLTEREMAAWCVVRGIDYVVEECPMAIGNRHAGLKETLNAMDERSPGTKASFYLGFLDRMAPLLRERPDAEAAPEACPSCGSPSSSDGMPCSFCRLEENAGSHEPVPVRMVLNRVARRAFDAQWGEESSDDRG